MGIFSRKIKVNLDDTFKDLYKSINQITMQASQELDFVIKQSLLELTVEKYNELIELIDKGANFDKEHFLSLKENAEKELQTIKNINAGE